MPFGSRQKGSRAEREVAKLICDWWQPVEPECKWVRTPLSGGWSTAEVRACFRACGDLMTTATRFPWVVEVKRREGWSWPVLIAGRASPVWSWWTQAQAAADKQGAGRACLWLRKSRWPDWRVLLHRDAPEALQLARTGARALVPSLWPAHCQGAAVAVYSSLDVLAADPALLALPMGRAITNTARDGKPGSDVSGDASDLSRRARL